MGQLQTRNTTIFFNDVEDGQFRAQALAATCESDLTQLASLFRIPFDIDGLNSSGVRVYIISPPTGGASNIGWGGPLGRTDMDINGDFAPAKRDMQTPIVRAELVRMLYVAELAEIMMDIAPGAWNRGWSDGEALSVVLATELRPMGYYGGIADAPRVNPWLQSERPDWISNTEQTDKNSLSYGCGILFINYLRHQLGFDLATIIGTRPQVGLGSPAFYTLADRYAALTGNPATQAYPEFMSFLDRHLPRDQAAISWVGRDDIFPLQDSNRRSVFVSTDTMQLSSLRIEPAGHVSLKPGLLCGERDYTFWRVEEVSQVTASASCSGFASASFRWSINGIQLGPASSLQLELQADVSIPEPDRTIGHQPGAAVRVTYSIDGAWNRSSLRIQNIDHDSIYHLDIGVTATERLMHDGEVTTVHSAELSTLHFEYGANFAADQRLCNGDLEQVSADLAKLSDQMQLFRVAPDPQPDQRLAAVLAAAGAVNTRIAAAAEKMGSTGRVFLQELGRGSRMAEEVAVSRNRILRVETPQPDSPAKSVRKGEQT
jgi:hypothetical protein